MRVCAVTQILFLLFFYQTELVAENLDNLLQDYYEVSDLSNKTRKESLGTLFVYTAEDLDRLQVTQLSDILRHIPLYTLNRSRNGSDQLNVASSTVIPSMNTRLFIDEQEVSNPLNGDSVAVWADMPMDFVSHVEVYIASGAFDLDTDPGVTIVRVYSRDPERQRGGIVSQSIDSEGGSISSVYYANTHEKSKYSLFASFTNDNSGDFSYQGRDISADSEELLLLANYSYNDRLKLQLGHVSQERDSYIGYSLNGHPESASGEAEQTFIKAHLLMQEDKSLDLHVGFHDARLVEKEENGTSTDSIINFAGHSTGFGVLPILAYGLPTNFYSSYDIDQDYQRFDVGLSKNWNTTQHKFVAMLEYQHDEFDLDNKAEGILVPNPFGPIPPVIPSVPSFRTPASEYRPYDSFHRYIVRAEESFYVTDTLSLYGSGRYDYFDPNNDASSYGDLSYRLGFSVNPSEPVVFKAFYNHIHINPSTYVVSQAVEDLDTTAVDMYSAEIRYEVERFSLRLSGGVIDPLNYYSLTLAGYVNAKTKTDPYPYIIVGGDFKLSQSFRVSCTASHAFEEYGFGSTSPPTTVNLSGTYKYERWSFLAQLGYSPSYTSEFNGDNLYTIEGSDIPDVEVDAAYDLTLGVRYHFNDDLSLDVKAYNILDQASETPYLAGGPMGWVAETVSVSAPRVQVTIRWVF